MSRILWLLVLLLVGVASCGGEVTPTLEPEPSDVGDPATGEELFHRVAQPPCTTCHSLEPDFVLAGPSLAQIGAEAGTRVPGMSAVEYLRQSIVEPSEHISAGAWDNVMLETYPSQLSEHDVNDLIAYLLTLR
jgi:cytochrome c2